MTIASAARPWGMSWPNGERVAHPSATTRPKAPRGWSPGRWQSQIIIIIIIIIIRTTILTHTHTLMARVIPVMDSSDVFSPHGMIIGKGLNLKPSKFGGKRRYLKKTSFRKNVAGFHTSTWDIHKTNHSILSKYVEYEKKTQDVQQSIELPCRAIVTLVTSRRPLARDAYNATPCFANCASADGPRGQKNCFCMAGKCRCLQCDLQWNKPMYGSWSAHLIIKHLWWALSGLMWKKSRKPRPVPRPLGWNSKFSSLLPQFNSPFNEHTVDGINAAPPWIVEICWNPNKIMG